MSDPLGPGARLALLLRSFVVQGAWNYRTMIGAGFAFTLLPVLRRLHPEPEALEAAVRRHAEHFNAHPYLALLAVGAVARMEEEGAGEEEVRRFKVAVRGALGGLGDTLVWATWLPGVAVLSLGLYWFGVPGWLAATTFVVVYNAGHLGIRVWMLRAGVDEGRAVGARLAAAELGRWTRRLQGGVALLLGILCGAILGGEGGFGSFGPGWTAAGAAAFVGGLLGGHRVWRPAAVAAVTAITLIGTWGILR